MTTTMTEVTFRIHSGGFIDGHDRIQWADSNPHADPFSRLYYIDGGRGRLEYAGRTFALSGGRCYLFPAHYPILHRPSPGLIHYYVHFTAHVPGALSLFDVTEWSCETRVRDRAKARAAMRRMIAEPVTASHVLQRQADLLDMVRVFLGRFTSLQRNTTKRFDSVVEYIHRNLGGKISLSRLAQLASLHPNYFSNQFTESFGVSPREYIMRKRIERAQMLLWRTDMRVCEIAEAVGCEGSAYFCRIFRRRTGMTPLTYRKQQWDSPS